MKMAPHPTRRIRILFSWERMSLSVYRTTSAPICRSMDGHSMLPSERIVLTGPRLIWRSRLNWSEALRPVPDCTL